MGCTVYLLPGFFFPPPAARIRVSRSQSSYGHRFHDGQLSLWRLVWSCPVGLCAKVLSVSRSQRQGPSPDAGYDMANDDR